MVLDLGLQPLANNLLHPEDLGKPEPKFPLRVAVCHQCWLLQITDLVPPTQLFSKYLYFSSFSDALLRHARAAVEQHLREFALGPQSHVVEIASNDGYLLQYFGTAKIPCLGIEPAANIAKVARERGVRCDVSFHGRSNATRIVAQYGRADLVLGNNVLAHVPDLNDFVAGMKILLKPDGVITMEFPHLLRLMEHNQFDTIYHEHFSYFSLMTADKVFTAHGLVLFDVEELPTHGGSIRIYARHAEDASKPRGARVGELLARELALGFDRIDTYRRFDEQVRQTKRNILAFLIDLKRAGNQIVGYGAPGKGNTLLNYCGIRTDFLDYTVDRNPYKQGKFTPGTHIPIHDPARIRVTKPDYIFILPWNLRAEITEQMAHVRDWGCRFIIPIPSPEILP